MFVWSLGPELQGLTGIHAGFEWLKAGKITCWVLKASL